jgi:selenocysteine lyase/cysteine desulfurase
MNADTDDLEIEDLEALLSEKTRLVCFTHCSNVVGLIHDVKEIVQIIHNAGAWACVDGVAYTPHRRVDVKELDVDFYLYSPYKVFGPHLGVLYGKRELLAQTANQSHYFLGGDEIQRSLCPGGLNFELTAACAGMAEYFDKVHEHHYPGANVPEQQRLDQIFGLFADHETVLGQRIEAFLKTKPSVQIVGDGGADRREHVGVYSFVVNGQDSQEIPKQLTDAKIGIYASDFYAARCIDALGVRAQNGVVRVSLAHYNSEDDVDRLIGHLDEIIH